MPVCMYRWIVFVTRFILTWKYMQHFHVDMHRTLILIPSVNSLIHPAFFLSTDQPYSFPLLYHTFLNQSPCQSHLPLLSLSPTHIYLTLSPFLISISLISYSLCIPLLTCHSLSLIASLFLQIPSDHSPHPFLLCLSLQFFSSTIHLSHSLPLSIFYFPSLF